jgi:hypothetical protein
MLLLALLAHAAPYRTGHHHAEFRWQTLQTRFFRVHYPSRRGPRALQTERTAAEVARVADELLLQLSAVTEWVPDGLIHVVVSDEAEGMTAYTLPHWRWIVLSADPGVDVLRLRGRASVSWVQESLAHELGHVVGHSKAGALPPSASYGLEGAGAIELGRLGVGLSVVAGPAEPYGWSEGAAELWSEPLGLTQPTPGRRATVHTSALEGRLLEWDELLVSVDKGDLLDAERAYQQGYAFARWLMEQTGRDVFLGVAESAGLRYPLSWTARFGEVAGEPARLLWARWRARAHADAVALQARRRALGLCEGRELEAWSGSWTEQDLAALDPWMSRPQRDREEARESTGSFELYPRTSPDGRWVAQGKVGWMNVWRGDPRDWPSEGDHTALREERARATSVWIPADFGAPASFVPGRDALVVVAPEDAHRSRLSPAPRDPWSRLYLVDLSPQPRRVRHRGGHLALEDLGGRAAQIRRRMSPVAGTLRARDPAVSPDGQRLAFLAYGDGTTNLVVSQLDGARPRALSAFTGGEWLQHPSWSPDGRSLVVSLQQGGRPDLWTIEVETGRWTRLTDSPEDELDPVWARDGIWFATEVDGVQEIVRLDPRGHALVQQTRTTGGAHSPWPLPDGSLLYTAYTAYGMKAMLVPAPELLALPLGQAAPPSTAPPVATAPLPPPTEPRPYRSWRSVLVPAVAPLLRLDADEAGLRPLAGAHVRVRDAIERVDLYGFGLLGQDLAGTAQLTWRGLPPELVLYAAGSLSSRPEGRSGAGAAGVELTQRLRDGVWAGLAAERWATSHPGGEGIRSVRAHAQLVLGQAPSRGARRAAHLYLRLTHAWSETQWNRLSGEGEARTVLPWSVGPLAEHRLRLEGSLFLGWTDRPVSPDEQLYVGGDLPGALRLGFGPPSVSLPGFAPYALGDEILGVARSTLLVPVAPRLRTSVGPLYLQELALGAGLGAAATPTVGLGEGIAELRLSALLFDTPWDGLLRAAWGVGDPGISELGERISAPPGGPRLHLGLGTAF